jgi:hypothetical protein
VPRITPSLVANFIKAGFDSLRERGTIGTLERGALQTVGALLAMLDRLDEGYLASLTGDQYRDLTIATEYVRATVDGWQNPRTPEVTTRSSRLRP